MKYFAFALCLFLSLAVSHGGVIKNDCQDDDITKPEVKTTDKDKVLVVKKVLITPIKNKDGEECNDKNEKSTEGKEENLITNKIVTENEHVNTPEETARKAKHVNLFLNDLKKNLLEDISKQEESKCESDCESKKVKRSVDDCEEDSATKETKSEDESVKDSKKDKAKDNEKNKNSSSSSEKDKSSSDKDIKKDKNSSSGEDTKKVTMTTSEKDEECDDASGTKPEVRDVANTEETKEATGHPEDFAVLYDEGLEDPVKQKLASLHDDLQAEYEYDDDDDYIEADYEPAIGRGQAYGRIYNPAYDYYAPYGYNARYPYALY